MKVLTTADATEWHDYVNRTSCWDIHFLPEMMIPYEKTGMGVGSLVVDEQGDEFAIQPLLTFPDGEIRHPYNFGGPIGTSRYMGPLVVPENTIFTLNPFLAGYQKQFINKPVVHSKDIVWVDLAEELKLRPTTRHAVERAEGFRHFSALVDPTIENITKFSEMYNATMDRLEAAPHWRFSTEWFLEFFKALPHKASLLFVFTEEQVVAGCILLRDFGFCYYHFAATAQQPADGVNHYMVTRAVAAAKGYRCSRLCLGGGLKADDGLFTFKAGFSKLRAPVFQSVP